MASLVPRRKLLQLNRGCNAFFHFDGVQVLEVGVHGPPGDEHHPPSTGAARTSCCRRARREAVGDVRVLVQPHPAAAALLEEGARDAPVRGAADASAPAAFRVRGDVRELELDVYLVPAPEGLPLLVADVEPLLRLPAGDGVLRKLTHLLTILQVK